MGNLFEYFTNNQQQTNNKDSNEHSPLLLNQEQVSNKNNHYQKSTSNINNNKNEVTNDNSINEIVVQSKDISILDNTTTNKNNKSVFIKLNDISFNDTEFLDKTNQPERPQKNQQNPCAYSQQNHTYENKSQMFLENQQQQEYKDHQDQNSNLQFGIRQEQEDYQNHNSDQDSSYENDNELESGMYQPKNPFRFSEQKLNSKDQKQDELINYWLNGLIDQYTDTPELILQGQQPKKCIIEDSDDDDNVNLNDSKSNCRKKPKYQVKFMTNVIFKDRPNGSQIVDLKELFNTYPYESFLHLKRIFMGMSLMKEKYQKMSKKLLKIVI